MAELKKQSKEIKRFSIRENETAVSRVYHIMCGFSSTS